MNFINLSDLYWLVSAEAPGLNKDTAIEHLREAAREFCGYSLICQETIETSIAIGDNSLQVRPSSSHLEMKMVIQIDSPRGPITAITRADLSRTANWRAKTGPVSRYFEEGEPGDLTLYPSSTKAEDIHVTIAVVPSLTTTKIPRSLVTRYQNAIQAGALARILGMANQTWSKPQDSLRHLGVFNIAKSNARAQANLNNGKAALTTPIRRQF